MIVLVAVQAYSIADTIIQRRNVSFWFAATVAYNDITLINEVVCINLTDTKYKEKIVDLINKINNGWLPED